MPPTVTDAALRRAPPTAALTSLCAAIQPGGHVGAVRRLRGGISSGMHATTIVGPDGERRSVVVRRYGAWRVRHDPRVAEREWAVLAALARTGAPAPRPLWLDAAGAVFGCPTLVTSRLPGRGLLAPRDRDDWVRQLADALAEIHRARLTAAERRLLLDQRPELDRLLEPEAPPPSLAALANGPAVWSTMRRHWPRIRQAFTGMPPVLVHGDFWPGNTLWRHGRLSGVVDWEQARRGDPAQDVACCRLDLTLLFGPDAAGAFVRAYQAASGRPMPNLSFWDLYTANWALEGVEAWIASYHDLGRADVTVGVARSRLAGLIADALTRAGAPGQP